MIKIAIVKLSAIGDLFQALKSVKDLKTANPHLFISWIVEKKYADAIKLADWIDEVIEIDTHFLRKAWFTKKWFQEFFRFKNLKFDFVFDLQGNIKSSIVTFIISARKKFGFDFFSTHEKIAILPLTQRVRVDINLPMIQQYGQILESSSEFSKIKPSDFSSKSHVGKGIFIAIGSFWENKKLSVDHWVSIVNLVGEKTKEPVYLPFFSVEEEKQVDTILAQANCGQKFPKSSLKELKDAFLCSSGVIGVDSALVHLSHLFGIKTYIIFGPSSARIFSPTIDLAFQANCPVDQKFIKRCSKLRTCPHGACLKKLEPKKLSETVVDQFLGSLSKMT